MLSMADEWEIQKVVLRYADTIDRRDWAGLAAIFDDEFVADYEGVVIEGGESLAKMMEGSYRELGPALHYLSNVVIEESETGANARSYIHGLSMDQDGEPAFETNGWFEDALVKRASGWKIRRRTLHMVRWQGHRPQPRQG